MALLDIRDNIMLAREFTADMTLDAFRLSRLHFYATTRALEIMSEAVRRLPDSFRDANPDLLPWKKIMGAGNIYRHDYDNVAETVVWDTVHGHLEPLLVAVTAAIDAD